MLAIVSTLAGYAPTTPVLQSQHARPARAMLTMGVESELGATPPLGYWDPLGLVRDWRPRTCTSTLHLSLHRRPPAPSPRRLRHPR